MLAIIGLIIVIMGFIVSFIKRKKQAKNTALRVGIINDMQKEDGLYKVLVAYSPNNDEKTIETNLYLKKKPYDSQIILRCGEDGVFLYKYPYMYTIIACCCWVIGGFLCYISR